MFKKTVSKCPKIPALLQAIAFSRFVLYNGVMAGVVFMLLLPFLGTALGASCVLLMRREMNDSLERVLAGFAAGVMVAASVWSLLIPSMEQSAPMGKLAFLPALSGFALGIVFLLLLDKITPHLHALAKTPEGPRSKVSRTAMLVFAVTLHNIPEGMAVGVVAAAMMGGSAGISFQAALALAIGIAIQNFPEGAIVSMPLRTEGNGRLKSFIYGALSGIVEPAAAVLTILLTGFVTGLLPYLLAFAAGAMIYVVVEELLPEASRDEKTDICTIGFAVGFALMMVLDVALS